MSSDERFKVNMAAYLVLIKDGKVLLSKRANTGYMDGNYSMVSGHFENGENAKQCIIRESLEEANIIVKPDDLSIKHVLHYFKPDVTYLDVFLVANNWEGKIINLEKDRCDGIKWFPLDNLPTNMVPEVELALGNIQKGLFYGELGW